MNGLQCVASRKLGECGDLPFHGLFGKVDLYLTTWHILKISVRWNILGVNVLIKSLCHCGLHIFKCRKTE